MHLIVVDVQPFYRNCCRHIEMQVIRAIETADSVTYYYNGQDVGIDDTPECIQDQLELWEQNHKIRWIEKGYGFLRDWMDCGVNDDDIIEYLQTRDEDIAAAYIHYGEIYHPAIQLPPVKFAHICGGGENECLKEMELYLEACNIQTKRLPTAIY